MLDVHPPHTSVHTWRDFLIHIATIVVGLLIAVGLEQSVEWLHHHHQREQLLEQLNAEHRQTLKDAEDSAAANVIRMNWYATHIEGLRGVIAQDRPYAVPPFPAPSAYNDPDDPVWRAAKASGLTPLLSQQVVIANSEPELLLNSLKTAFDRSDQVSTTSETPACGRLPLMPGSVTTTDYAHADARDLRDCLSASMETYQARMHTFAVQSYLVGAEKAILAGETNIDRIAAREMEEFKTRRSQLRRAAIAQ